MKTSSSPALASGRGAGRTTGLVIVFLWFFVGGIAHFALTDQEMRIMPPYIPWPRAAVLASGVPELLGAAGLWWFATRRAAGWLLFLTTIAVTPVHVWMLQTPERWDVPYWVLVARLPLQAALLWLILWSTARPPADKTGVDAPAAGSPISRASSLPS